MNMAHSPTARGYTIIEVTMVISLVAIGLAVAALGYRGYREWAFNQAAQRNANVLVMAVLQAKSHGVSVSSGGNTFPRVVTITRANEIFAEIGGPISIDGSSVEILPSGFAFAPHQELPPNWRELSPGIFEPIPN